MFGKVPFCTVSQPTCMRKWRLTRHHRLSTLICRSERGDSYIEHTSSMVCSKPWKDSLDETFLTQEIQQTLRNVDPEAESRYSLMKLEAYQRVYKALWLAGEVAPVGSQWHRLNQYCYTMHLTSLHNSDIRLDRSDNKGIFTARYETAENWKIFLFKSVLH